MRLTHEGIKDSAVWEKAGITLPSYNIDTVVAKTKEAPMWVHFGIGNIFRVFLGGIADRLLEQGVMDKGITCVECFDYDVVDMIYRPYDNLGISVILHGDGHVDRKVLGAMTESIKAQSNNKDEWSRLKEIFRNPKLQMASFTITEKGYALKGTDGEYLEIIKADIENGPERASSAMAITVAMLNERFLAGAMPIACVSMDNCSKNGQVFRDSVLTVAKEWKERGFVGEEFITWLCDESKVSFPWTMIDKITPRPNVEIARVLEDLGLEDMQPVITSKKTFIAPFMNAESPQYLVVEDNFPNGRPEFEKAGVYMTDRETVNKAERMKVTVCLNPIHSALGTYGVIFGYALFSDEMKDEDMLKLGYLVGAEGMEVVPDPKILSPEEFFKECMEERFPNPYLGDTCARLTVDISQGLSIRFGETIKAYMEKYGSASNLKGISLALAGWLRYLLGVDDDGNKYELNPDPLNDEMIEKLAGIIVGEPDSLKNQLKPILSNETIFGVNLYEAGLGTKIEEILKLYIAGPGAVREVVRAYLTE